MNRAAPSMGIGERRSSSKGVGIEFAEHRPYRSGDDVRHLDPRVLARLGESYVRQYFVDRQLPVYVLLDGSRSMLSGSPQKFETATLVAQLMGFVGLAAGDRVQVGFSGDGGFKWSLPMQGPARSDMLFSWFDDLAPGRQADFGRDIERASRDMAKSAYVIVVSDWWDATIVRALDQLDGQGHDIVGVQIASPDEIDPSSVGTGSMMLVDDETGEELETVLDEGVLSNYRAALADFQRDLRQRLVRSGGQFFALSSAVDMTRFFLRDLRAAGVLL